MGVRCVSLRKRAPGILPRLSRLRGTRQDAGGTSCQSNLAAGHAGEITATRQ